jgi:tRNA threonylcarbamoyladenosine biosynthesis protein TsaB
VVGVPTLEALARASRVTDGLVCPIIDARKGEVYAALYRASGGVVEEMRAPCAVALDAWLASLPGPCTFIGDAVSLLPPGTRVLPFDRFPPSGSAVAACGRVLIERRGPDDLAAIEPLYVRPPEAEIHPIAVR